MPSIFSVYLFTGDDEYLKKEAVRKLKKALLGRNKSEAFNFNAYDAEGCDIREVTDMLKSAPFLCEKRVVLLTNIGSAAKDTQQAVIRYVKNPSPRSCLILQSSRKGVPAPFQRELARYAREIEYNLPKGGRITNWITKEVKNRGKTITRDAALLLKELKEDSRDSVRCEIEKLVTYVGRRSAISRKDIEAAVGSSVSRNVFAFVDALSSKDAKEALAIAEEMLRAKKQIPQIMGMIGWQLRRLKEGGGYFKKGSLTPAEIDASIAGLLDADYRIKTGRLKPRYALETLIVRICSGSGQLSAISCQLSAEPKKE